MCVTLLRIVVCGEMRVCDHIESGIYVLLGMRSFIDFANAGREGDKRSDRRREPRRKRVKDGTWMWVRQLDLL